MPMVGEYHCSDPDNFKVTGQMIEDYKQHGFILVRGLLSQDEIAKVRKTFELNEQAFMKHSFELNDSKGRNSRLCNWNQPGNDPSGILARCEKVARTSEKLMDGGEIFHYHSKLIMKEAHTGGKFIWHQDYGYWYYNGNIFPDLLTAYFAIDRQDKDNGCMQIVRGSHRCGRIEHKVYGGQQGADEERVNQMLTFGLEHIVVELDPGDCLFFHANVVHKSAENPSPRRRWALTISYNLASNEAVYKHHHSGYVPLDIVPDSELRDCSNLTDLSGKDWMDPTVDKTITLGAKSDPEPSAS